MNAEGIDHVNIRVPEDRVGEAVEFYQGVLGFKPEKLELYREGERTSFAFRISGSAMLHIRPVDDFVEPEKENYDHFCILVSEPVGELREHLEVEDVEIIREGNPWGATGRAPAIYIRDPFGYVIEFKEDTA